MPEKQVWSPRTFLFFSVPLSVLQKQCQSFLVSTLLYGLVLYRQAVSFVSKILTQYE